MKVKRVCAIDTGYCLLQYLLLSSMEEISSTYFFWGTGINDSIKSHFLNQNATISILEDNKTRRFINKIPLVRSLYEKVEYAFLYYFFFPFKWGFLRNNEIFFLGCCHLDFSNFVFRNHLYTHLEDGTMNYRDYPFNPPPIRNEKLWKTILGKTFHIYREYAGSEETCKEILLSGISDQGKVFQSNKYRIVDYQKLWDESSDQKKQFINSVFDFHYETIVFASKFSTIILTQPLSEDMVLSVYEEQNIWNAIIKKVEDEIDSNILIKPHPRENKDFSICYLNKPLLYTTVPMELLSYNGIRFKNVITIFSTAALSFNYPINLYFIGTQINEKIETRWPEMTESNFKSNNPNITLKKFPSFTVQ